MANATWGDDVNVIIETGGSKDWAVDDISNKSIQRHELKRGNLSTVEDLPLEQMSTSSALSDFLKWGVEKYPAERYGLILWDHGGGVLGGYGNDELYNMQFMSLDQISKAIKESNVHLDFVGFDACLMGSFETAYALKDYVDYLIASEEEESGIGWYYTDWLNMLGNTPNMSTEEIGHAIVDGMTAGNQRINSSSTLSVIDLSKIDAVYDAWLSYLKQMQIELNKGGYDTQADARINSRKYGDGKRVSPDGYVYEVHTDMIDMLDFADRTGFSGSMELKNAIVNCIVYNKTNISGSNGLSVYMPYYRTEEYIGSAVPQLQAIGFGNEYFKYFDSFCSFLAAGNPDVDFTPTETTETPHISGTTIPFELKFEDIGGEYGVVLSKEQVKEISSIVVELGYRIDREAFWVLSMGEYIDIPPIVDLQDSYAFLLEDEVLFSQLFSPDSGESLEGYSIVADSGSINGALYQLRYMPAILNGKQNIYVIVESLHNSVDDPSDDYTSEVLGYVINDGNSTDNRTIHEFSVGDTISTNTAVVHWLNEAPDQIHIESVPELSITYGEHGFQGLFYNKTKSGNDVYRYIFIDIYNNCHYTEWTYY